MDPELPEDRAEMDADCLRLQLEVIGDGRRAQSVCYQSQDLALASRQGSDVTSRWRHERLGRLQGMLQRVGDGLLQRHRPPLGPCRGPGGLVKLASCACRLLLIVE